MIKQMRYETLKFTWSAFPCLGLPDHQSQNQRSKDQPWLNQNQTQSAKAYKGFIYTVYIYICIYIYMYICICIYMYMYLYVCIYFISSLFRDVSKRLMAMVRVMPSHHQRNSMRSQVRTKPRMPLDTKTGQRKILISLILIVIHSHYSHS